MSDGLAYFKEVYGAVPEWVGKMHTYRPDALDHYTNLRSAIMEDGLLSSKEKDLLLVGINAARCYERSMLYHTKGAIDSGATIPELMEYLLVAYLYGGQNALQTGIQSVKYALSLKGLPKGHVLYVYELEYVLRYFISILEEVDAPFVSNILKAPEELRDDLLLVRGVVSAKMKSLLMVGIHSAELKGREAGRWMEQARSHGATEGELAEVGLICLLTAGIPAWFEASDSLFEGDD
ncbi:carboxymuconolactone decarboxylase family protein [Sporosarcina sp. ACRSL]|uniref:carboxymuconolactone decarboxylase family protein n=1 Tax=Sporosarcina sp. ACRSL TaxID=2918215 RepID=UPI001EF54BC7|nr:carboxymuconolactone decarboxylase family protein [Sporosarcina sp. ACRSL]MCG7343665.1 carboxymuconolactone decarboxylase family protein [Sporosarcina sp. ACRSL]